MGTEASTDLSQPLCPVLEWLSPHSYYARIRPVPLAGVARTMTLSLHPLVNLDINKDGLLLGVEIIDTGPYKDDWWTDLFRLHYENQSKHKHGASDAQMRGIAKDEIDLAQVKAAR